MERKSPTAPTPRERVARVALLVIAVIAFLSFWIWWKDQELRELGRLPDCQRRELYLRTVANLTGICSGDEGRRLPDFCRDQAEIAIRLPECDPVCERVARAVLHQPLR